MGIQALGTRYSVLGTFLALALNLSAAESAPLPSTAARCAAELGARHDAARSIVARLRVVLTETVTRKELVLRGAYISDSAGRVRLRVTAETGQLLLDFGAQDDALELCLPHKERFYRGSAAELLQFTRAALLPLTRCSRAGELLFPTTEADRAVGILPREQRCTLGDETFINAPGPHGLLRRVCLDARNSHVKSIVWFKRGGAAAGRLEYAEYAGHAYPGRISIDPPGSRYRVTLEVEDLALNTPLAAAKFSVPIPANFKCETLSSVLAAGDFWR